MNNTYEKNIEITTLPINESSDSKLPRKPTIFQSMGLAGTTAVLVVNITHPIEVVKTRLQVDFFLLKKLIKRKLNYI